MRMPFALSLVLAAITIAPGDAPAAPQALALLASNGAVPLSCAGGTCRTELSAFCLQQARAIPLPGTKYSAVDRDRLTLVITAADGAERRLPAPVYVKITSARMYTAVTISISEHELANLGAVSAAIEVGDGVTLVPDPVVGDPLPQTVSDIKAASGPIRAAGTRIVDHGGEAADTARVIGRLINALPPEHRASAGQGAALWREVIEPRAPDFSSPGLARGHDMYRSCHSRVENGATFRLRECLEAKHGALMQELNAEFWTALKVGS